MLSNVVKGLYKAHLWEQLWGYKCEAIIKADMFEYTERLYRRYRFWIDLSILGCAFGSTVASVTQWHIADTVFSALATVLSGYIMLSSLDETITSSALASKHFTYLYREIEKYMNTHNSTIEFKKIYDIVSSFFIHFEGEEVPVPHWIIRKFARADPPVPKMPDALAMAPTASHWDLEKGMQWLSNVSPNEQLHPTWGDPSLFLISSSWPPVSNLYRVANTARFLLDREGYVSDANDQYCELFGVAREDLLTLRRPFCWIVNLHNGDGARVCSQWFGAVDQHKAFFDKFRVLRDGGTLFLVCEVYPRFDAVGRFLGMEGMYFEIPEKKWHALDLAPIYKVLRQPYNYDALSRYFTIQSTP